MSSLSLLKLLIVAKTSLIVGLVIGTINTYWYALQGNLERSATVFVFCVFVLVLTTFLEKTIKNEREYLKNENNK